MKKIIIGFLIGLIFSGMIQAEGSGYNREPKKGTIISGTCLLVTSYAICAVVGLGNPGGEALAIPIVGPLVQIGVEKPIAPGVIVYSGISLAQAIGLALIIRGIVGTKSKPHTYVSPYFFKNGGGCVVTMAIR